jgi:hypothetical protein
MADNEKEKPDRGPCRFPLGDMKQAKRTLARITRDILNGRIAIDRGRAAVYAINTLIQIFKIENPQLIQQSISAETTNSLGKIFNMTYEERKQRIIELTTKLYPNEKQASDSTAGSVAPALAISEPDPEYEQLESQSPELVPVPAGRISGIGVKR